MCHFGGNPTLLSTVAAPAYILGEVIFKGVLSSELSRYYILSFALHNFFTCPMWLLSFPWLKHLSRLSLSTASTTRRSPGLVPTRVRVLPCPLRLEPAAQMRGNSQDALLQGLLLLLLNQRFTHRHCISENTGCWCACVHAHTLHAQVTFETFSLCRDVESW